MMLKKTIFTLTLGIPVVLLLNTASSFALDPRVRQMADVLPSANTGHELESYTFSSRKGEVKSAIQCLGGYKFALVSSVGHQGAPQPAASIIQVYEDLKGRIVPAKC